MLPGDVFRIVDRFTRPSKVKRHICICVTKQVSLRINTEPIFKPCHLLPKAGNAFLEWDSYVELTQMVRHYAYDLASAQIIGRITSAEAQRLLEAVAEAATLTDEQKALISERLRPLMD